MYVGIDIGTQSLKAVVTGEDLLPRASVSQPYQPSFPRPGWAEQDPLLWERALGPAIAACLVEANVAPHDVRGVGIGGQLDGCVAVDATGAALGPCLIWMDRRAIDQMTDIPAGLVRRRTGIVPDAGHMAAKARWLKRHRPTWRVTTFHQPVSYMVARLTGAAVMDRALASTTMVAALGAPGYDGQLLNLFGIEAGELPRIDEAASCAGLLHADGAALTGLPIGTPVAVGTGDDFTTPLGAGLVAPGRVAAVLGTAEVVGAIHDRPIVDDLDLVETHAYPGGAYFIENPGWLSGGAVAWLCATLGLDGPDELDRLAAATPIGADGLVFLPALSGAMAPRWRPAARGCFYGLTAAHGRGHLARAVLEGCAFAMRDVVDRLSAMGVPTDAILLLGGGARSRIWAQLRADIAARHVTVPSRIDTAPIGGAMLAAVASGGVDNLATAAAMVGRDEARSFAPERANCSASDDAYHAYRQLFDALESIFVANAPRRSD
ncbi:MAG: hypothetical protein FJX35_20845 [Alphaproteobacteria bacterium]|nr:hypothetical protein [Alphaproteobacteria bacterium]